MPKMHLTTAEASALQRQRKRDKAHNTVVLAAVEKIKLRLKKADALETGILTAVLNDLRTMVR